MNLSHGNILINTQQVTINTSLDDGRLLQKLATEMRSSVTLTVLMNVPNEDLYRDLYKVTGDVHVDANVNEATVSFGSLEGIVASSHWTSFIVNCPVDTNGVSIDDVADMVVMSNTSPGAVEQVYAFNLPVSIPVQDVMNELVSRDGWNDRQGAMNGPENIHEEFGDRIHTTVGYDGILNRITVRLVTG